MQDNMLIGLYFHKVTISVAVAQGERGGEVHHWGTVPHRPDQVCKLAEKLAARGARLHFCHEAGSCGYGLYRQLVELGHGCIVVASSLRPCPPVALARSCPASNSASIKAHWRAQTAANFPAHRHRFLE